MAFCLLAYAATVGLAGKAREVLQPKVGTAHAAILSRFAPDTFLVALSRYGATYFSAVPAIYARLAELPAQQLGDTEKANPPWAECNDSPADRQSRGRRTCLQGDHIHGLMASDSSGRGVPAAVIVSTGCSQVYGAVPGQPDRPHICGLIII